VGRFLNPNTGEVLTFAQSRHYRNVMFWVPFNKEKFPEDIASMQPTTSAPNAIRLYNSGVWQARPVKLKPGRSIRARWSVSYKVLTPYNPETNIFSFLADATGIPPELSAKLESCQDNLRHAEEELERVKRQLKR
jgi:hypothetical protein